MKQSGTGLAPLGVLHSTTWCCGFVIRRTHWHLGSEKTFFVLVFWPPVRKVKNEEKLHTYPTWRYAPLFRVLLWDYLQIRWFALIWPLTSTFTPALWANEGFFLHKIWHKFQDTITLGRFWNEYFDEILVLKYWYAVVNHWHDYT